MGVINSGFPRDDKNTYFPYYMNTLSSYYENLLNFPNDCKDNSMWTVENLFESTNNYPISNFYYLKNPFIDDDTEQMYFNAYPFISINNPNAKLILWNEGENFSGDWTVYVCARDTTNRHDLIEMMGELYQDIHDDKYACVGFNMYASNSRYPYWDGTNSMATPSNISLNIVDGKIYKKNWARYIMTSDTDIKESVIRRYAGHEGSKPSTFITNIPMFCKGQEQAVQDFIINGTSPAYIPTKTDFKLWIKGLNSPSYKLNWHNTQLEDDNYNFSQSTVKLEVGRLVSDGVMYQSLAEVPYTDGSIKFTFYDLTEIHQDSIFSPWLYLRMSVTYEDGENSGKPYVQLRRMSTDFSLIYSNPTNGEDGSTITVVSYDSDPDGYDNDNDDYHEPEDNSDNTPDPSADINITNNLCRSYVIDPIELKKLSQFLWSDNFIDNIKLVNNSPIENISSLKAIIGNVAKGESSTLVLGNTETTSSVNLCNETHTINVGSFTVPNKYNNFLDFEPYTKVSIYLPFYGVAMLDSSIVVGRTISIKYIIDVVTGTSKIKLLHADKTLYEYKCSCGADLPITASNRASVEMGYISSGIGVVGSVASGNLIGGTMSLLNMAQSSYHSQTSGNCNGILNFHDTREVTIIVDRPVYQELRNFNATHGRVCNLSKKLGDLNGFTICNENVRLNFNCLKKEEELLRNILTTGFII